MDNVLIWLLALTLTTFIGLAVAMSADELF